jgi:N-acetylneuraminic acid mutarotase
MMFLCGCTVPVGQTPVKPASLTLKKVGEYTLQTPRQGAAAVAHGGYIYIFGGGDAGPIAEIERFDPRTHRVETMKEVAIGRRYHRAVEFGGKIYLFGGQSETRPDLPFEAAVEIYDPATHRITRGADMPEPRTHMAVARLGNKIVIAGGVKHEGRRSVRTNRTDFYDPASNSWSQGAPMPTMREGRGAAVGDRMIVPGGFDGAKPLTTVEAYLPAQNKWQTLAPLSRAISAHSLVKLDHYLFLFGDYTDLSLILAYDADSQQTLPVTAKFEGYRHTAAVVQDRKIYVVGGNNNTAGGATDLIQVFELE